MNIRRKELAKMIDHTLVTPTASREQIEKLCIEAKSCDVHSVCVNSVWISLAVNALQGTKIKVSSTVGFPFGASLSEVKVSEAKLVVELGAEELDMVMNLGALKSQDIATAREDIRQVVNSCGNIPVKVIVETGYLSDHEKVEASRLVKEAGAAFVKTSTGFLVGGATVADVMLIRETVGPEFGVKAAGGIRTLEHCIALINAGANRIGSSSAVSILKECPV